MSYNKYYSPFTETERRKFSLRWKEEKFGTNVLKRNVIFEKYKETGFFTAVVRFNRVLNRFA